MDKVREGRLIWYSHAKRRGEEYISRGMLEIKLRGRRARRRIMDTNKEDMVVGMITGKNVPERAKWKKVIHCCNS